MMNISDMIADTILRILEEDGIAEIRRNDLAEQLGCVPSQINYVITSRFRPEQGYIVESRRGGSGYVRITRLNMSRSGLLMHVINSIGDSLDAGSARVMTENLFHREVLGGKEARLILTALSDHSLRAISPPLRDQVRADLFKQLLASELQ